MHTGDTNYIYKNYLDQACFHHDIACGKYKDLTKWIQSDKVIKDKAFEMSNASKYDTYQRYLASMVYNFFDKKNQKAVILNLCQIKNLQVNVINQLLENFKKEKILLLLKTIFGVLI